jgi:hypothetical protein
MPSIVAPVGTKPWKVSVVKTWPLPIVTVVRVAWSVLNSEFQPAASATGL